MRYKVNVSDSLAFKLAAAANQITQATASQVRQAVRAFAPTTESKARELASERLHSTRQQYDDALAFRQTSEHVWVLTLDESAAHLEEGYGAFDMIAHGLASKFPPKGRAKIAKDGSTYVTIPFTHPSAPASERHPEHSRPVQRGQPSETTRGSLAQDLQLLKKLFQDTGTTKTPEGNPVQGKVYSITKSSEGPRWNYEDVFGNKKSVLLGQEEDRSISPLLSGLTKVQVQVGKRIRSQYVTWRTASSKHQGQKFLHPGFHGVRIMPDLERWAIETINRQLADIFRQ